MGTIRGVVRVPGSKSAGIRALALAAMANGVSSLGGMGDNDDLRAMARVATGFGANVDSGAGSWTVSGGLLSAPLGELDVGESGLTARIALAMAALVEGEVTVIGRGRLVQRPMAPLLAVLRTLGLEVREDTAHLPVTVRGRGGFEGRRVVVDTTKSTQFLSALLIVAPMAQSPVEVEAGGSIGAIGYVDLTLDLMERFGVVVAVGEDGSFRIPASGYHPARIDIPPDASSAAYPLVGAAITGGEVEVHGLAHTEPQSDMAVIRLLELMGCEVGTGQAGVILSGPETLQPIEADLSEAPDGALALAVACLFAEGTSTITGLHTLRHKESDRLLAMSEGLTRLGGRVWISEDSMEITPVSPRGATVRSHGDHRVAMSLALAGLRLDGVAVEEPDAVAKTWPEFWDAMRILVFSGAER